MPRHPKPVTAGEIVARDIIVPSGHRPHMHVIEVDELTNVPEKVILRTAFREGSRPTGTIVCRRDRPFTVLR
jgi:hypothetical protein